MNRELEDKTIENLYLRLQKKVEFKNNKLNFYSRELTIDDISNALNIPSNSLLDFILKNGGGFIAKNKIISNESFKLIENYLNNKNIKLIFEGKSNAFQEFIGNFQKSNNEKRTRTPIVSVMGHIDHGKSTLLDSIMQTNEQGKEEGGITQKISFYDVLYNNKKISFLDTPGHSLFIEMREKSASFTDLIILVIDANEGLKKQTLEIIKHIHNYKIPVIIFLNNKSKETLSQGIIDKVMSSLQDYDINPIEWGGEVIVITGRANNKEDALKVLETVYELSEIYDWRAEFGSEANGIFLDSSISDKEGIVNIILVKNGTLKKGDNIFTANSLGKINRIVDKKKKEILEANPGDIVNIFGLNSQFEPGDNYLVVNEKNLKKKLIKIIPTETNPKTKISSGSIESGEKALNIIILANTQTSLSALNSLVNEISKTFENLKVRFSGNGDLSDKTFEICKELKCSIVLFNAKLSKSKELEAKKNGMKIISSTLIHNIEKELLSLVKSSKKKKMIEKSSGLAEVKKIFYSSSINGNIAGCDVINGSLLKGNKVDIFRLDKKIFTGEIKSLQRNKINAKEVKKGQECAIVINVFNDYKIGDKINSYTLIEEEND